MSRCKIILAISMCFLFGGVALGQAPDSTPEDASEPYADLNHDVETGSMAEYAPLERDGEEVETTPADTAGGDSEKETLLSELIIAELDIMPGAHPNTWTPQVTKVLHIAVAGAELFDVLKIDPESLALARVDRVGGAVEPIPSDEPWLIDVTGEPGEWSGEYDGPLPDGFLDLQLRFNARVVAQTLALWKVAPNTPIEVMLSGKLNDGTAFESRDSLVIDEVQPYSPHRKRAQRLTTERE